MDEVHQEEFPGMIPPVEMVTLRHPHTGDTQIVPATTEALHPLMGKGYQQVRGE